MSEPTGKTWAVVRVNHERCCGPALLTSKTIEDQRAFWRDNVAVLAVLPTPEQAAQEVERLNAEHHEAADVFFVAQAPAT
jgi:hypothetical protein